MSKIIGIDLGTTKIIIYRSDSGIALNEPSIVAYNTRDNRVVAVGNEAYAMLGKTPKHIVAERPLKDGVISNHKLCELMIKEYIKRVCGNFFIKPRIILCIPSVTTDVERRSVVEAALAAGARKVYLIENHSEALKVIRHNIAGLDKIIVLAVNALQPAFTTEPVDMIFMDAPYREELWEKALTSLAQKGWVSSKTLIVIEIEDTEEGLLPSGFVKIDDRQYGRGRFLFCQMKKR